MSAYGTGIILSVITSLIVPGFAKNAAANSSHSRTVRPLGPVTKSVDTSLHPSSAVVVVRGGDDLQAALNSAGPGQTLELESGATFSGNFYLPARPESPNDGENGWITIRSSESNSLSQPGVRIDPSAAFAMARIVTENTDAALKTQARAHHYRLIGIELTVSAEVSSNFGLIRLGDSEETNSARVPHHITIDRCFIHGNATANVRRGVALNCASAAIIDSWISECHEEGADAQAICGWNGPGPFKIVNNYLEASGENVMFGGADPKIQNLVPSDIEFRRNHCFKPLSWKQEDPSFAGIKWSVKNLFELKNAQRVFVCGNVFENAWTDGQTGIAILFKSVNQDGTAPWSATQDVEFIENVVRHCGGGVNIQGFAPDQPGGKTRAITIRNNLFDDIGGPTWGGDGAFLKITGCDDLTVSNNTIMHTGNIITAYGEPSHNVRFANNVLRQNDYGVKGDGTGSGGPTLARFFPGIVMKKNVLVGASSGSYPRKNFLADTLDDVGFIDRAGGNYRLGWWSPYKNASTTGADIGADLDAIENAQAEP